MAQLYVDDAFRAFKAFEKLSEKIEVRCPMAVHRIPIQYDGPGAWAVYENTNRKRKNGDYVFKKKELIFEKPDQQLSLKEEPA